MIIISYACNEANSTTIPLHVTIVPDYTSTSINLTRDTLRFPLAPGVLPETVSFNYFEDAGRKYVTFCDNLTRSLNVYDVERQILIKQLHPGPEPDGVSMEKMSAWMMSMDSIYVVNSYYLYKTSKTGKIQTKFDFTKQQANYSAQANVSNITPPVFKGNYLYLPAYPDLFPGKLTEIRKMKMMYRVNLDNGKYTLLYKLPAIYQEGLYGALFIMPFYCYNGEQFIYSFAADPNIYVTDLETNSLSFTGQSQYLDKVILPVKNEKEVATGEGMTKAFNQRDSYGPIFYDPFRRRYLRVAEKKVSPQQLASRDWTKSHTLIIFDENFKIIGESIIDKNINLYSIFTTPNGIYARTDGVKDENSLYFVRLQYVEKEAVTSK